MSYYCDEYYSLYKEKRVKARIEHKCDACGEVVSVGHYYFRVTIIFDGQASTVKRCLRCQALHKHLRNKEAEMWPDEQLACGKDYEVEWGHAPPPEVEMLAFISQEESQRMLVEL